MSECVHECGFLCPLQETQPVLAGAESEEKREEASTVERLFGSEVETVSVCRCGWSSTRQSTELLFSLLYPHNTTSGECVYHTRSSH